MSNFDMGLALAAIPVIIIVGLAIDEYMTKARLNKKGIVVYGRLQEKHIVRTRGGKRYNLVLRYQYEGNEYTRTLSVKKSRYDTLATGDQVAIACLPAHPKTVGLAEDLPRQHNPV